MSRSASESHQKKQCPRYMQFLFDTSRTCHCFPRMQRERAEMELNFAREIGNLVQRLSSEKDQLEAELKLKMDQEVSLLR